MTTIWYRNPDPASPRQWIEIALPSEDSGGGGVVFPEGGSPGQVLAIGEDVLRDGEVTLVWVDPFWTEDAGGVHYPGQVNVEGLTVDGAAPGARFEVAGTDLGGIIADAGKIVLEGNGGRLGLSIAKDTGAVRIGSNGASTVMKGTVTLSFDPVAPLEAATKQYVDGVAGGGGDTVDFGAPYKWSTDTTAGDPGHGYIKGNGDPYYMSTEFYISAFDSTDAPPAFGPDRGLYDLATGDTLWFYTVEGDPESGVLYELLQAPEQDTTTYEAYTLYVTAIEAGDNYAETLAADAPLGIFAPEMPLWDSGSRGSAEHEGTVYISNSEGNAQLRLSVSSASALSVPIQVGKDEWDSFLAIGSSDNGYSPYRVDLTFGEDENADYGGAYPPGLRLINKNGLGGVAALVPGNRGTPNYEQFLSITDGSATPVPVQIGEPMDADHAATKGYVDAAAGGGGGGGMTLDVQVFSTPGTFTWTKPAGAISTTVSLIGGGGGGASGRKGAADVNRYGGGGGGAGAYSEVVFDAARLGATEAVIVGAGGVGGAPVTTNDTNGLNGVAGSVSKFGANVLLGGGGARGTGGTTTSSGGGAGGAGGHYPGGGGGGGGTSGGTSVSTSAPGQRATGGGGGGGVTAANATGYGGPSGWSGVRMVNVAGGMTAGTDGGWDVGRPAALNFDSIGGGGGAGSITGNGGAGGKGIAGSGGGGGGGATNDTGDSGVGGKGGDGLVVITTWIGA